MIVGGRRRCLDRAATQTTAKPTRGAVRLPARMGQMEENHEDDPCQRRGRGRRAGKGGSGERAVLCGSLCGAALLWPRLFRLLLGRSARLRGAAGHRRGAGISLPLRSGLGRPLGGPILEYLVLTFTKR